MCRWDEGRSAQRSEQATASAPAARAHALFGSWRDPMPRSKYPNKIMYFIDPFPLQNTIRHAENVVNRTTTSVVNGRLRNTLASRRLVGPIVVITSGGRVALPVLPGIDICQAENP